ncbi:centromere kinetochore component CENP-T-domain-containing protein [Xylariaceae sp. FL0662B]|nr:centromere kinetochore component CENP-T-domain-containing protein [Xylariaceae sp. FL0662B]
MASNPGDPSRRTSSSSSRSSSSSNGNRLGPLVTPRPTATPNRRALSAEPSSNRLSASGRRTTATAATPHARAAIRALDQRRAALFTPGRARRRSLREQRETPRDLLRNLSRVLAPASTAAAYTSSSSSPGEGGGNNTTLATLPEEGGDNDDDDDDDDDFPIERPRFSLPLGLEEDDDDDSELKPPRSSGLEEENYTVQSIELPRRAWSESRLDRGSFGSVRVSDYAGPDLRSDDVGIDSGFFPPPALDVDNDSGGVVLDEQAMIERSDAEEARRQTLARESLFGPIQLPEPENESTFMMAPVSSPTREQPMLDGIQEDDAPQDDDHTRDEGHGGQELSGLMPGLVDDDNDDADGQTLDQLDETVISRAADLMTKRARRKKNGKRISRHGIEYPSLPPSVVKRIATTFAKTAGATKAKISPDTLDAIMQATDWFFEQLGDDLSAYARHAGRKTIDESDMITLMRRQRQTSASTTPFALAQRHLPRELLQELRMSAPVPKKVHRKKSRRVGVDGEEEVT